MESEADPQHDDPFAGKEPSTIVTPESSAWTSSADGTPTEGTDAVASWSGGRRDDTSIWASPAGSSGTLPTVPMIEAPGAVAEGEAAASASKPSRRPAWLGRAALVGATALVAGSVGAAVALAFDDGSSTTVIRSTTNGAVVRSVTLDGKALNVAGVIAKAEPSVVSIQTVIGGRNGGAAAGTGIVLTADGEILTNAHVIQGAT
jgi:ferric-dicitrate binding protein FerR (iron transport regulator)